jgi:hypothetical protein
VKAFFLVSKDLRLDLRLDTKGDSTSDLIHVLFKDLRHDMINLKET